MDRTLKTLYRDIAKKLELTEEQVIEAVSNQFLFVRKTMGEGVKNQPNTFKTVQLTNLGKFATRDYKLKEYKRKADDSK